MIIRSVRMRHFGRFSDKEITFSDGLNIVEGVNEAGKSTLHAFIRGMLFGIEKNRGRAGKDDIYTHYLPWDSPGAYQGSLDLEHNGQNIRISRSFLQNAKSCVVTDLDTGETLDWGENGITALIGELTPNAFDNTVSCAQQQLKSKGDFGDHIRTYIANIADSRDSQVDVAEALNKLDDKARTISRSLKETDEEAAREALDSLLEDEKDEGCIIADRDDALETIERLENELNELEFGNNPLLSRELKSPDEDENNLELLQKKIAGMQALQGRLKELEKAESESEDNSTTIESFKSRLSAINDKLDEKNRTRSQAYEKSERLRREYEEATDCENDPQMIGRETDEAAQTAEESRNRIDELKNSIDLQREKARKMLISGGILSGLGLLASYLSSERLKAGIITGILLMIAGLVILLMGCIESKTVKNTEKEKDLAERQYREDADKATELQKKLHTVTGIRTEVSNRLQQAELQLKDEEASFRETEVERDMIRDRLCELEKDSEKRRSGILSLKNSIYAELKRAGFIGETRETADFDIREMSDRLDRECSECTGMITEFLKEHKRLEEEIAEKNKELARIEGILSKYGDIGERIDDAMKKLEEIRTEKSRLQTELEAVRMAAASIRDISDELKGSFDRRINDLLSKVCAKVTAGKYMQARITYSCEPEVLGDEGYIPVKDLSVGTGEQVFLAFRLAMSEFLFGDEELPMIFDEVFAYYDDERLRAALEAISNLGRRQVILFTCSHREIPVLDELGITYDHIVL